MRGRALRICCPVAPKIDELGREHCIYGAAGMETVKLVTTNLDTREVTSHLFEQSESPFTTLGISCYWCLIFPRSFQHAKGDSWWSGEKTLSSSDPGSARHTTP